MNPASRSKEWGSLLALLVLLPLGGCREAEPPGDPGMILELAISPTPPAVGPARLIISLRDTLGNPLDGADVQVEGNMNHAGMVPVTGTALVQGPGLYVLPDFRFTMAGGWILTVTARLPDGREASTRRTTNVVGAPQRGHL
jgi:hypothetical protein